MDRVHRPYIFVAVYVGSGFVASPSVDATDVMKTLYTMPEIDQSIYGKSIWTGKEIYGCNQHLLMPIPKYVVSKGKFKLSGVYDLGPWWEKTRISRSRF